MSKESAVSESVAIKPPNLKVAVFRIVGTSPYVQNAFSKKALETMHGNQAAGSTAKKGQKREAKDFDAGYQGAMHKMADGTLGIPSTAFRAAAVSACRLCGFKMTLAKLSVFILADGFDAVDGTPLTRFVKGKPHYCEHAVRNDNGSCDLRARAMWDAGWEADVRIQFDADQFTLADVANLLARIGLQAGIGEGRADSKNSVGMGWGFFAVSSKA